MPSMKHRGAVIALSIVTALSVAIGIVRRMPRRADTAPSPGLSARAAPKPPPLPSVSPPSAVPEPKRERPPYLDTTAKILPEQRDALFTNIQNQLDLPVGALAKIEAIFAASDYLGQGEPKITKHPMTRAECRAIRREPGGAPGGRTLRGVEHGAAVRPGEGRERG